MEIKAIICLQLVSWKKLEILCGNTACNKSTGLNTAYEWVIKLEESLRFREELDFLP
jgi:hypothetical protein